MKNLKFLSIMQLILMVAFVVMKGLCLFEVIDTSVNTLGMVIFGCLYVQACITYQTLLEISRTV